MCRDNPYPHNLGRLVTTMLAVVTVQTDGVMSAIIFVLHALTAYTIISLLCEPVCM